MNIEPQRHPDPVVLQGLVERALEVREETGEVAVEELCADFPECADAVREALDGLDQVESWAEPHRRQDDFEGRVLSERYRLQQRIGTGAMGAVYRGEDLELKRPVAVKILQPHLFGAPDAEARFGREAEALAALRHPHVVAVYDRGTTGDGLHFLVMELLGGAPLSHVLAEQERQLAQGGQDRVRYTEWIEELGLAVPERSFVRLCARWAADLAAGLAAAHRAGIFHRDVKPSNIWITEDGRALLLDFGIAARADDATLTRGDTTLGTPKYMPPEQAAGPVDPAPTLDVYSLSATLYHLLSGQAPYQGEARTVLAALQRQDPPPVGKLNRGLPVDLQAIVEHGMARDPGRRYATAGELEADLRAFLDYQPVSARRAGAIARTWRRARRSRLAQAGALVVVAAASSIVVPAWFEARAEARNTEHREIMSWLPPMLTFGSQPVVLDLDARADIARRLDRAVDLKPDDVATRSLRAGFRIDHGDVAGAAADMQHLAEVLGTEYARNLAACYAAVAAGRGSKDDLDGSGVTARPVTAGDRLLAGYQLIRDQRYAEAEPWLALDSQEDSAARELWMLLSFNSVVGRGSQEEKLALYEEAVELRGRSGASARLDLITGALLVAMNRPREAIETLRPLAERTPEDWSTTINLTAAYFQTDAYEAAESMAHRALQIRPEHPKALNWLAKSRAGLMEFDAALVTAERIPVEHWRRHEAKGFVELMRALELLTRERAQAREAARASVEHYGTALDLARQDPTLTKVIQELSTSLAAGEAIVRRENGALCTALLGQLRDEPDDLVSFRSLSHCLPSRASPDLIRALRAYFDAEADRLALRAKSFSVPRKRSDSQEKEPR